MVKTDVAVQVSFSSVKCAHMKRMQVSIIVVHIIVNAASDPSISFFTVRNVSSRQSLSMQSSYFIRFLGADDRISFRKAACSGCVSWRSLRR